jgi:predicted nucleic-acid-binding Zn-ribbon protein
MSKQKCPNCGHFTFSEDVGRSGVALFLIFGVPLLVLMAPGAAAFYGGEVSGGAGIIVISILLGFLILLYNVFSPSKTVSYTCDNCKFKQVYSKKE